MTGCGAEAELVRCSCVSVVLLPADDESRVILPMLEGDPHSDYINANYLNVSFCVCFVLHLIWFMPVLRS